MHDAATDDTIDFGGWIFANVLQHQPKMGWMILMHQAHLATKNAPSNYKCEGQWALSYAEEAYKWRTKLLDKMFIFHNTKVDKIFDDNGEVTEIKYSYKTFRMISAVAQTAWSPDKCSSDSKDFVLTPWNVLECFLESILQVARLLAVLYASDEALSKCNSPCVNHWAAYFHQASIGTYLNNHFSDRHQDHIHQEPVKVDKIEVDLEASVVEFFSDLPNVSIICISTLEDNSDFLSNLLPHSPTSVWIVLSRLNSNNVPIFVMLPVASTFQDSAGFRITEDCSVRRPWDCPWVGDTVIDRGDLKQLEHNLAEWFSKQKFEGNVGTSPTEDKLSRILEIRDILIYIGHGSGTDCISGDIVRNLDRCAAAMLIGCSSGSLHLNGSYPPDGVVLDYLVAGSPAVVSNLWDITTSNATQITKTLVKSLMHSKDDKTTVGSSMGSARESCYLPYLQGASLICYGIQTRIKKRVRFGDVDVDAK
ncbi:separase [Artemisia annua]|uniref:separase n=1 Tax=Artemisia annua TaxID=35608 RepID=A0A2U1MP13_ARTAN|nr:separase [Artemisia annua]